MYVKLCKFRNNEIVIRCCEVLDNRYGKEKLKFWCFFICDVNNEYWIRKYFFCYFNFDSFLSGYFFRSGYF